MAEIIDFQQKKDELAMARAQKQQEESQAKPESAIKRMGWGIFLFCAWLILLQFTLDWVSVEMVDILLIPVFINVLIWFLLRPYRKSMREAKLFMDIALVFDSIPIFDLFPLDLIALIYTFVKSRSKTVQKVTSHVQEKIAA